MTPLKAAILQAHQGMALLTSGKAGTMREIAEKLKMNRSYLGKPCPPYSKVDMGKSPTINSYLG